jgi:sterol desaturase/sphingolipid hydroxylase (fatty acid hydroxylase superfamily)
MGADLPPGPGRRRVHHRLRGGEQAMTAGRQYALVHDDEPLRLFRSDFLEVFTHIHPLVVLLVWLPVAGYFAFVALRKGSVLSVILGFLLGLFVWTPIAYLLHRFVFHFPPRGARQERILFQFHGVHHVQPKCKTRLAMPPVVSIPLAVLFYAIFWLVLDAGFGLPGWLPPLFAGFIAAYLVYDMIHYATHHFPMRRGLPKALKRYHMQHHYKTPNARYGVSSPLWDLVFGIMPR